MVHADLGARHTPKEARNVLVLIFILRIPHSVALIAPVIARMLAEDD